MTDAEEILIKRAATGVSGVLERVAGQPSIDTGRFVFDGAVEEPFREYDYNVAPALLGPVLVGTEYPLTKASGRAISAQTKQFDGRMYASF